VRRKETRFGKKNRIRPKILFFLAGNRTIMSAVNLIPGIFSRRSLILSRIIAELYFLFISASTGRRALNGNVHMRREAGKPRARVMKCIRQRRRVSEPRRTLPIPRFCLFPQQIDKSHALEVFP
jgi:hypothetical protein